jgi:hypothetical protein
MPGPCNNLKKKQKLQAKKAQKRSKYRWTLDKKDSPSPSPTPSHSPSPTTPTDRTGASCGFQDAKRRDHDPWAEMLLQKPYIHDPGNGPRVRDARTFLDSYFAQPPALDDPLCAEFAQEEVFQMLCTILPEEAALVCCQILFGGSPFMTVVH